MRNLVSSPLVSSPRGDGEDAAVVEDGGERRDRGAGGHAHEGRGDDGARPRQIERAHHRGAVALHLAGLGGERAHGADAGERLLGDLAGAGQRVLHVARELADAAPVRDRAERDGRHHREHEQRQLGRREEEEGDAAGRWWRRSAAPWRCSRSPCSAGRWWSEARRLVSSPVFLPSKKAMSWSISFAKRSARSRATMRRSPETLKQEARRRAPRWRPPRGARRPPWRSRRTGADPTPHPGAPALSTMPPTPLGTSRFMTLETAAQAGGPPRGSRARGGRGRRDAPEGGGAERQLGSRQGDRRACRRDVAGGRRRGEEVRQAERHAGRGPREWGGNVHPAPRRRDRRRGRRCSCRAERGRWSNRRCTSGYPPAGACHIDRRCRRTLLAPQAALQAASAALHLGGVVITERGDARVSVSDRRGRG